MRIKPCQTSSVQNGVFGVKLCYSRLENANTSKPGGRIPSYKRYECVPLILKGKGFSVPVAHPHPAPHRVPPPRLTHLNTSTRYRIPTPLF